MKPSVVRSVVTWPFVLTAVVGIAAAGWADDDGALSPASPVGGLAGIERSIRASEYHVTWQDATALPDLSAAWHAPNRAHNLRFYFTDEGLRVVDRTAQDSPELLRLRVVDSIFENPIRDDAVSADGNQLEILRQGLTELFVNDESGLRHVLTINNPPPGGGPLVIELVWSAAHVAVSDQAVEFRTTFGRRVVYSHDRAVDATGMPLELTMSSAENRIRLALGGSDPVFPITVENLLTGTANTILEGNQPNFTLGSDAGAASGDFNGDGYADVAAVVPGRTGNPSGTGAILIFHGGPTGIPNNGTASIEDAANSMIESDLGTNYWPMALTAIGDVNGDGFDDLAAGHKYWDPDFPPASSRDRGGIWLFHGSPSGITASQASDADGYVVSNVDGSLFGAAIGGAGDVNGDGYADLIVGAYYWDDSGSQADEGAAYVFHGSESGITVSTIDSADTVLEGNQAGVFSGTRVGGVGDLNGDGFDDVMVGVPFFASSEANEGAVAIFHGSAQGIADNPTQPLGVAADALIQGNISGLNFSGPAAESTDVNGDGYADLVLSAGGWGNDPFHSGEGVLLVFHGGSSGIDSNGATPIVDVADTVIEGNPGPVFYSMQFGIEVITAGDVNGDGYGDVAALSNFFTNPEVSEGGAFVFLGREGGIPNSRVLPVQEVADFVIEGNMVNLLLGQDVPSSGDVNGDGFSDLVLVSSTYTSPQSHEGAVLIYHGGADGLSGNFDGEYKTLQAVASFGASVASAGDVNGDGFSDLAVGAPWFDGGQLNAGRVFVFHGSAGPWLQSSDWTADGSQTDSEFGASVAMAGDVNGDGFGDLVVGAPHFSGSEHWEGEIEVFHGSATGLSTESDWSFESDQADATLGWGVAAAGDVNGDGYGDLIAGAPGYSNGQTSEGRALVFFGSGQGLAAAPGWVFENDVADAIVGLSVAGVGDVNGDGIGDVVVGASGYTSGQINEGAAYGFLGAPQGLPATPNWFIETNRQNSGYGSSVAGAGDVNGDGYGDVVVGAPNDSNPESSEGRAYIYHGSGTGLSTIANSVLERNHMNAYFGYSVASAGDVNGDGYSDLVIGSPSYPSPAAPSGRAELFLGSGLGIVDQPVWNVDGTYSPSGLGSALAGVGDFNGDGFADVAAGLRWHSAGVSVGGSVELYLGNAGAGRPVLARQLRGGGDPTPVQPWGLSYSGDAFQVSMTATSPRGRELARLHVEACPPGDAFGDVDCRHAVSADWTEIPLGAEGVTLTEALSGLTEGELYQWRAHVLLVPLHADEPGITPPPVPHHGPWRRLFALAPAADIRMGAQQQVTIEFTAASGAVGEGSGPAATAVVIVSTSDGQPTEWPVSVDFMTFEGGAVDGVDYMGTSGTVQIAAGVPNGHSEPIPVDLIDDDLDEPDEEFFVEIINPINATLGAQTAHTVTILDNDPTPEISASDLWVDEGVGQATIILELSGPSAFEVEIAFATQDGTAIAGEDYEPVDGVATFPPTTQQFEIHVPIFDDSVDEPDEEFFLELWDPQHAVLLTPVVTVTITDNDLPGLPFEDGFESGDTSAWSVTMP